MTLQFMQCDMAFTHIFAAKMWAKATVILSAKNISPSEVTLLKQLANQPLNQLDIKDALKLLSTVCQNT